MTGQPPPNLPPSRDRDLGFDELLAIFIALAAIGSILFWGLTRRDAGFNFNNSGLFSEEGTIEEPDVLSPASPEPDITPRVATEPGPTVFPQTTVESDQVRQTPVVAASPSTTTPRTEAEPVVPVPVVVAPPPSETAVAFPDVPEDYWAYPFIADLTRRGVISGLEDGTFAPEQPVTRAQFATLIQKVLPAEQRQQPIAFSDVGADYWASGAIDTAVEAGFLRGFPDGTFQPDQPVSHTQVLASLANGLELAPPAIPATDIVSVFADANQIPEWAVPIVATATTEGLVVNHPNPDQLQPNQPATRAEVAATIYQALETTGQVEPIQSRFIVQP